MRGVGRRYSCHVPARALLGCTHAGGPLKPEGPRRVEGAQAECRAPQEESTRCRAGTSKAGGLRAQARPARSKPKKGSLGSPRAPGHETTAEWRRGLRESGAHPRGAHCRTPKFPLPARNRCQRELWCCSRSRRSLVELLLLSVSRRQRLPGSDNKSCAREEHCWKPLVCTS